VFLTPIHFVQVTPFYALLFLHVLWLLAGANISMSDEFGNSYVGSLYYPNSTKLLPKASYEASTQNHRPRFAL